MGMYTEILVKAHIKRDIPIEVKEVLEYLFTDNEKVPTILPEHEFFKDKSWRSIGSCNSFYHVPITLNFFNGTTLFSRSDLKNYSHAIELFFDWIQPYVNAETGQCIGYKWYEEWSSPTLIYKE